MSSTHFIVFSGYNQRAVIAFLRTAQAVGAQIAIVAAGAADTIFLSDYAKYVVFTREDLSLAWPVFAETLCAVRAKLPVGRYVIAPTTEALNRFIVHHRQAVCRAGFEIPLVEEDLYRLLSDKAAFVEVCRQHGFRVPNEYGSLDDAPLPLVAKPRQYLGADGKAHAPVLIWSEFDRERCRANMHAGEWFFQDFVRGESFYLFYFFSRKGEVYRFSQRNLLQQPEGKSVLAAVPAAWHETDIAQQYEELLKSLSYHGPIMLELRALAGGGYCMIEANPRFWGPSQLCVDAGRNFMQAFLADEDSSLPPPVFSSPIPPETRYFWHGGLCDALRKGQTPAVLADDFDWKASLDDWIAYDVYRRPDTMRIYSRETCT